MAAHYLENVHTGKRYKIVGVDKKNNKITLQGSIGTFEEEYDKEKFKRNGYRMVVEEEED